MVVVNFVVVVLVQWLVVVVVVVMMGVLALVMDFREVMMTSPPELAHKKTAIATYRLRVKVIIPLTNFVGMFPPCPENGQIQQWHQEQVEAAHQA